MAFWVVILPFTVGGPLFDTLAILDLEHDDNDTAFDACHELQLLLNEIWELLE